LQKVRPLKQSEKAKEMNQLHVNSWIAYQKAMDTATCRIAVDAGGNDGGYAHTLIENGFVTHVFEPVPAMYRKICDRFSNGDKPVYINQMGLSDKRETIEGVTVLEAWSIGKIGDGGLIQSPNQDVQEIFTMHTITLDEYLGDTRIGLLKLDVDGYEHKVLKGAEKTLRRDKPPILCEFNCYLHKMFGKDEPEAMVNFIFSLGYEVWSCDGVNCFKAWAEIEPQWPYHSSFDVILLPK